MTIIDLTSPERLVRELPIQSMLSAVGLDYDHTNDTVYWTDTQVSVVWPTSWNVRLTLAVV